MAPAKGSKPEVNPWSWASSVEPENIGLEQLRKAYRVVDYKPCEDPRRNCRRNPFCYWGLGEKKWGHNSDEGSEDDDNGFREEGEFAGLQNLGATCYVNSLLQLWFHNPILRPAILRWRPITPVVESYQPSGPIAQLQAMFARLKMSKRSKIDPTEFVKSLQLDTTEQQDAQEFSKLFMEVILKNLTAAEYVDPAIRDAVASTFRGELQNETECTGCKNKTRRQESFNELELGVRKDLNESLDDLLKEEILTLSEQYFCSVCDSKNDAIRRTKLLKLPPVLNLQLMRFVFDRETLRKKKVTTSIQFPEVLDMTSRVTEEESSENKIDTLTYHLSAVLIHNGPSTSSGHYIAQIKDLRTGAWLKFNDENVDPLGRGKSQKLILKEDEGSGSDSDKGKHKKIKTTGVHNSQGAYMLVYTLNKYIKQPEPDPEPWSYLDQLIKFEDEAYQEEVKKSKTEKEYDNNLKEQRKREISELYPSLQQRPNKTEKTPEGDGDVDGDDDQPPKKKTARLEINGVSKPVESKQARKQNGSYSSTKKTSKDSNPSNGGVGNSKSLNVSNNDDSADHHSSSNKVFFDRFGNTWESILENMNFISSEWLQQWLDPVNPPPPMENKTLCCEHGKLAPPSPNVTVCPYKVIPESFANELYLNYSVDGPRFKGAEAFCDICVKSECLRLRKLQELENDYKLFLESNKKFDGIQQSKEKSESFMWLSKEALRNWKRTAKSNIENEFKTSEELVDCDAETEEESDGVSLMKVNTELVCPHANLTPNETIRKSIPEVSWHIIKKYFPDAIPLAAGEKEDCEECLNVKRGDTEIKSMNKELAQKQKSKLLDLYLNRGRPSIELGSVFLVSQQFITRWKKFIRDPIKYDPVENINNQTLLCSHNKFMYPLHNFLPEVVLEEKPEETLLCLVYPTEWNTMLGLFSVDTTIKAEIFDQENIQYDPEICNACATDWWVGVHRQKFNYTNQLIHIVRRDKDKLEEPQTDCDDLFIPVSSSTSTKRARTTRDPMGWTTPIWRASNTTSINSKEPTTANSSNHGVRRSARKRGEKSYKVSSTTTLKELKVMIIKDFCAFPSDQHLFYEGQPIGDDMISSTLGELQITADSTLYLEVDTASKHQEDDPVSPSVETGFRGTLLMGGTSASSPDPVVDDDLKSS
ncbi:ubiquitin carboxyl-terminal hydrolase 48 [Folsomia candida]|nr:ubiquitin carboxyl-terminal hydrolase 48 [Folsomia candida]XP_035705208.1 ubiquitin carboxyl-terminal hydrolase 48 [Folsomia candida]